MKTAVIGTGYVGLVQGAGLAWLEHDVVCIDRDEPRIHALKSGKMPFFEPGLDALVKDGVKSGKLTFSSDLQQALREPLDVIFIAVGTPPAEDGAADLSALKSVARQIRECAIGSQTVVVVKSTVPPGTTRDVVAPLVAPLPVLFNPEFLAEGTAVDDFRQPSRIVLGSDSTFALERVARLYYGLEHGHSIYFMDSTSAELTKYASNSMLAARIALMNEVAGIADAVGANVTRVSEAVGADPRIGKHFLRAGVGYGGSCFSKDIAALSYLAREQGVGSPVLDATHHSNIDARIRCVESLEEMVRNATGSTTSDFTTLDGLEVAVWGLAFKPGTDDIRDAPALDIITMLQRKGAHVRVYDPQAMENARRILDGSVKWCVNATEAAYGANAVLLLTEWPQFLTPNNLEGARFEMKAPSRPKEACYLLLDGRNAIEPELAKRLGFVYRGIGRR